MTAEFFEGLLAAPLVVSLFLEAALLLLLNILTKSDNERVTPWFYSLIAFFALRDVAAALLPALPFAAVSDALAPAFAAAVCASGDRRRKLFVPMAAGAAVLVGAAYAGGILRGSDGFTAAAAFLGAAAGCALIVFQRDKETGFAKLLQAPSRIAALAALLLPPLAALAAALIDPAWVFLRGRVFVPLSYLAFAAVILDYARAMEDKLLVDRDYLSDTIDKLYNFVFRASDSLRGGVNLNGLLEYVAQSLRSETNADGAMVLLVDDFEDLVSVKALDGSFAPIFPIPEEIDRDPAAIASWMRTLRIPLGEGLIGETAQTGKPSLVVNAAADSRIVVEDAVAAGSVIAVPFLLADRVIGVGVVARFKGNTPFADADFDRVSILADFASLVINDVFSFMDTSERGELDQEAAIAANIQKALQPKKIQDAPTAFFGNFCAPARGVSSDFYDVIPVRRDRIYLVMGDIAGKGVPASLIMVMIRAILHLLVSSSKDTATILNWINRGITGRIELDHFATLQVLALDPTTGKCEFANAGHRPPLVWKKATGNIHPIDMRSVPIGVEKSSEYKASTMTLENGDILLMYTDGVVEAMDSGGRQFGVKALHTILEAHNDLSPKELANKVRDNVRAFIGNGRQHDDQTLLAVKVKL